MLLSMPKLLLNRKKHKQEIRLCYSASDEVALQNSNLFLVSMNVSEKSFPYYVSKNFWILYLGCGCIITTFDFTTQMTSSHLLPYADE